MSTEIQNLMHKKRKFFDSKKGLVWAQVCLTAIPP